ncbi:MAG: hypothetical protein Q8M74_00925, partial [Chloroflexota bacterium]|nr:hypothetical protein [Chloroflexota bacterium]
MLSRRRNAWRPILAIALAAVLLGGVAVWSNALGVGDKVRDLARRIELVVDPPPDRPIAAEVRVTPRPSMAPTPTPVPTLIASVGSFDPASKTPTPAPTPTPMPQRVRVDVSLYARPDDHFITQTDREWCAVAGTQMVLAAHGKAELTASFQRKLAARIDEWESRRDSLNGGWGPAAMVKALEAYGVEGYE